MEEKEKKNLDEIITLYLLEEGLCDIYVEGDKDYYFFNWFFSELNFNEINIYRINDIYIPSAVLEKYNLNDGNRSRIIALSNEIDNNINDERNVFCVIDKDFDGFNSRCIKNTFLFYTDYPSLEVYLWNKITFHKFINLVLGGFEKSIDNLFYCLTNILNVVFKIRVANEILNWNMTWLDFSKYIFISNEVIFEEEEFIRAYLSKNSKLKNINEFKKEYLKINRIHDKKDYIRGHDISVLLYCIVKKWKKRKKFGNSDTLEGAYLGCADINLLCNELLFVTLKSYLLKHK